ncbi:ROK family protein [Paenibacillus sp. Soil750]|uniref:ROK family protein n=1 Tax=Paenibacillus sp. Soil750 TaxID=1736398 RepID=UPI0006FE1DD4|nr:ROK family protein [Paenibacillus sp. Soil750]KRE64624.1 ROK family transcriptional regulator [Paenibacillus sp. Soil750]
MMTILAGFDIGGTKCAVTVGRRMDHNEITLLGKVQFSTPKDPYQTITKLISVLEQLLLEQGGSLAAIGISCGGPLDSKTGVILSPPNLPGWDHIPITSLIKEHFGVPVGLQNDANACALAEWRWGAGVGTRNMIFLTFGTGMGAGLILDGKLYTGTNDMAGEIGHMRLEPTGPIGYGKAGSFEGFCSGGGIVQLGRMKAAEASAIGQPPSFCQSESQLDAMTAQQIAEAAQSGDLLALQVFRTVGVQLGRGLSVLVDLLNPELIVIGSMYARQRDLLEAFALEELQREALPHAHRVCRVVPAGLGELVGDYASLSVAEYQVM